MDTTQVIIVIPVALTAWANAQANALGNGGPAFGLVLLSSDGTGPATHTACNVRFDPPRLAAVQQLAQAEPEAALYAGDEWTWEAVLADAGLVPVAAGEGEL